MKTWLLLLFGLLVQYDISAQPVRVIVGYPAGGPADLVARRLEPRLAESAGGVVIENLPGAGGGLAVQKVLDGAAREDRWLIGTISEVVLAPLLNPVLGYRAEQLRLVGVAASAPVALVGAMDLTPTEFRPLLDSARASARELTFGNFGQGSLTHLLAEDFVARAGLRGVHVPYGGMQPLLRDLIGGRVDLAFVPAAAGLRELVAQGRLRLYALATAQRDPALPQVPTVGEAPSLQGFQHATWVGLFVPAQATEAALARARQALHAGLRDAEFQRLQRAEGSTPGSPMNDEEVRARFELEAGHLRRLLGNRAR